MLSFAVGWVNSRVGRDELEAVLAVDTADAEDRGARGPPELARAGASPFQLCAESVCGAQVIRGGDPCPSVFIGSSASVLSLDSRVGYGPRLKIEQLARVSVRRCLRDQQSAPEEGRQERDSNGRVAVSFRSGSLYWLASPLQGRDRHEARLKIEQSVRVSGRRSPKCQPSAREEGRRRGGGRGKIFPPVFGANGLFLLACSSGAAIGTNPSLN